MSSPLHYLYRILNGLFAVGTGFAGKELETGLADGVVATGFEDNVPHIDKANDTVAVFSLVLTAGLDFFGSLLEDGFPPLEPLPRLTDKEDAPDDEETREEEGDKHDFSFSFEEV